MHNANCAIFLQQNVIYTVCNAFVSTDKINLASQHEAKRIEY